MRTCFPRLPLEKLSASIEHVCYPFVPQLVKMAKRLKKEKVSVDIINFGEEVSYSFYRIQSALTICKAIFSNLVLVRFFPHHSERNEKMCVYCAYDSEAFQFDFVSFTASPKAYRLILLIDLLLPILLCHIISLPNQHILGPSGTEYREADRLCKHTEW